MTGDAATGDSRWFADEAQREFAEPWDGGDVDCEFCGYVHEAEVECD